MKDGICRKIIKSILTFCHYHVPDYIPQNKDNERHMDTAVMIIWIIYYLSMIYGVCRSESSDNIWEFIIWLIAILPTVNENIEGLIKGKNRAEKCKKGEIFHREIYFIPLALEFIAMAAVTTDIVCNISLAWISPNILIILLIIMLMIQTLIRKIAVIMKAEDIYKKRK